MTQERFQSAIWKKRLFVAINSQMKSRITAKRLIAKQTGIFEVYHSTKRRRKGTFSRFFQSHNTEQTDHLHAYHALLSKYIIRKETNVKKAFKNSDFEALQIKKFKVW